MVCLKKIILGLTVMTPSMYGLGSEDLQEFNGLSFSKLVPSKTHRTDVAGRNLNDMSHGESLPNQTVIDQKRVDMTRKAVCVLSVAGVIVSYALFMRIMNCQSKCQ